MRKTFKIFGWFIVFLIVVLSIGFGIVYFQVSEETATRIDKGAINRVIFSESPVYYDDGETVIGVFFEETHRNYILYQEIPSDFVKALIASEDSSYFSHPGFDVKAVLRAFFANVKARRVVQGGSTITQQTAKNIFKRERRSYKAKLKELIQAMLLEKKYSKEEILEMYVNQFFVTGFGRGLRIASQYFFDKNAEDLDLVEAAFIAGSVKGPYVYNPFIKKTESEKMQAKERAKGRKDYVLKNMFEMRFITEAQYLEARKRPVPFKQGTVTYRLNVILDHIREQLQSDYFKAVFQVQGIDNIATSGIKIYTSVNQDIQKGALNSLRRRLPLMDIKLNGLEREQVKSGQAEIPGEIPRKPTNDLPFLCRITKVNSDENNPTLAVTWENGDGVIDYKGLEPAGEAWLKGEKGNRAVFGKRHITAFLKNFRVGDIVAVQLLKKGKKEGESGLFVSKIPKLNGGIVVLRDGVIKGMVGGFHNRFFNRAVDAKRQLGSIFKPIVYVAALQLKWNSLDPLVNEKDLFRFENSFYIPRPDHKPQSDRVSMAWAGVKSENLATVWLLYHLSDRLTMGEFRQLVKLVGLDRKEGESYNEYEERIRDTHGVVVGNKAIMQAAFEEAKKEIEPDMIFGGQAGALANLRGLHFDVDERVLNLQDEDERRIFRLNYQRLKSRNLEMKRILVSLKDLSGADLVEALNNFYYSEKAGNVYRVIYADSADLKDFPYLLPITPQWLSAQPTEMQADEIWVDNTMPSKFIDLLEVYMKNSYTRLSAHNRYDPELLFKIRDFKTLVNLLYVTHLSKKMGIFTKLDPVLSFPLGSNAISLEEAALAYQTIMTAQTHIPEEITSFGLVPIITKIVDREGETIYEYRSQPKDLLSDKVAAPVSEVLRLVMVNGTGRAAKNAVQISMEIEKEEIKISIPGFGKTGTANQFTNSSFVGFIPGPNEKTGMVDIRNGYVIASYVGYDDNRPMEGKQVNIYGASGALPLWIDTANTIVNSMAYLKDLQVADLVFEMPNVSFIDDTEFRSVAVSPINGLPLGPRDRKLSENHPWLGAYVDISEGALSLKRVFEPLQGANDE